MRYIKVNDNWIENPEPTIFLKFINWIRSAIGVTTEKIQNVEYWFLELNHGGKICREIAFDKGGNVLYVAPYLTNRGQWSDSNITINPDDFEHIDRSEFEVNWAKSIVS